MSIPDLTDLMRIEKGTKTLFNERIDYAEDTEFWKSRYYEAEAWMREHDKEWHRLNLIKNSLMREYLVERGYPLSMVSMGYRLDGKLPALYYLTISYNNTFRPVYNKKGSSISGKRFPNLGSLDFSDGIPNALLNRRLKSNQAVLERDRENVEGGVTLWFNDPYNVPAALATIPLSAKLRRQISAAWLKHGDLLISPGGIVYRKPTPDRLLAADFDDGAMLSDAITAGHTREFLLENFVKLAYTDDYMNALLYSLAIVSRAMKQNNMIIGKVGRSLLLPFAPEYRKSKVTFVKTLGNGTVAYRGPSLMQFRRERTISKPLLRSCILNGVTDAFSPELDYHFATDSGKQDRFSEEEAKVNGVKFYNAVHEMRNGVL